MRFTVYDDTHYWYYNVRKHVQRHLKLEHNTDINIDQMTVEAALQDNDCRFVNVDLPLPASKSFLGNTRESEYEHSRRFFYSNTTVEEAEKHHTDHTFVYCNGDTGKVRYERVHRKIRKKGGGLYETKDLHHGVFDVEDIR